MDPDHRRGYACAPLDALVRGDAALEARKNAVECGVLHAIDRRRKGGLAHAGWIGACAPDTLARARPAAERGQPQRAKRSTLPPCLRAWCWIVPLLVAACDVGPSVTPASCAGQDCPPGQACVAGRCTDDAHAALIAPSPSSPSPSSPSDASAVSAPSNPELKATTKPRQPSAQGAGDSAGTEAFADPAKIASAPACDRARAQCAPGDRDAQQRACGNCDLGTQSRERSCTGDCRWGHWSSWSECSGVTAECAPRQIRTGVRACGFCGTGTQPTRQVCTEQCKWGPMTGSAECKGVIGSCNPEDTATESRPCGACSTGKQTRSRTCSITCTWSDFEPWSECQNASGGCEPGETSTQQRPCGACGSGVQVRTRSCTKRCQWGKYGGWGGCSDIKAACEPGEIDARTVACTTCGERSQQRTCNAASCAWSAWTDTSACSWCEQCAVVMFCDTPDEVARNRGTWCRQNACSPQQALDDCKQDVEGVCGETVEPFFMQYQ